MMKKVQGRSLIRTCASCLALLTASLSFTCFPQGAQAAAPVPGCAWQYNRFTANAAWSDANAAYWITPFTVQADLTITVHGVLPTARYFSLTTYNSLATAGEANEIHDTQIAANADGSYTVNVSHLSGPNTIRFANLFNGTTGYLLLRVYVPQTPVQLPSLTFTTRAGSVTLQTCESFSTTNLLGLFNNPDTTYLEIYPPYPFGNTVTVLSGRAPTQVRYWSLCSYLWNSDLVGCRYDGDIPLDNGDYHVVIGQAGQKSAIVAAGYAYLPYGVLIVLRDILGSQTTGDYAPVVKTCALTDRTCIEGSPAA